VTVENCGERVWGFVPPPGKPGNLMEFVNSGKLMENSVNLKFTQGIYQMCA